VRSLDGIKPLIALLSSPKRDVQIAAAGAIMNATADSTFIESLLWNVYMLSFDCC